MSIINDALDVFLAREQLRADERIRRAELEQARVMSLVDREQQVGAQPALANSQGFNQAANFMRDYQPFIIGGFAVVLVAALMMRGR